jgi:hypothetical protein
MSKETSGFPENLTSTFLNVQYIAFWLELESGFLIFLSKGTSVSLFLAKCCQNVGKKEI